MGLGRQMQLLGRNVSIFALSACALVVVFVQLCRAEATSESELALELPRQHPVVTCTAEELSRLRDAYRGEGAAQKMLAKQVKAAAHLGKEIEFPPRGGQHNQWYQCKDCQMGLKTVDDTHHRCPKCDKVYTGYPYDDRIYSNKHGKNLAGALDTAWAYAITGEERFAEHTAKVLLGYAERYREFPYHGNTASRDPKKQPKSGGHLYEQTLTEASAMAGRIAPAYDLIHDSEALSDAERARIKEGLFVPMLENMDKHKTGKSNWQSWHNAAMLWGGAVIGEVGWVRKAIEDGENGFLAQMEVSVMPEGMWYENSWGYHFYTLRALAIQAEGARRLGVDLWSHKTFKKMFLLPVEYTMADGSLPRFGDDVNSTARSGGVAMEQAYHAYGEPAILALLERAPTFESVLLGREAQPGETAATPVGKVFEGAGHAILRSGGDAGMTAALTFGPYGGYHGHLDKLSFVLFGHGRELGVDAGRARSQAYRLPIHKNWYKATVGHNAVLVDGVSQKPAEGNLLAFENGDGYSLVRAACDSAYPGVKHMRTLVLMPGYALLVDELEAERARQFDWVYHNRGKHVRSDVAMEATASNSFPGAEYIQNVVTGRSDDNVLIQFEDEGLTTYLRIAGEAGTGVLLGDGPGGSVLERIPLAIVTRHGERVGFAAVLEPVKAGESPTVEKVSLSRDENGVVATVARAGGEERLLMNSNAVRIER